MEPEMTDEQARALSRQKLEAMTCHVAMAAFVLPAPATSKDVINNGTMSFLETPKEKLLVTNHHVWDAYCSKKDEIPGLRLAIMGEGFGEGIDISSAELVDENEGYDLAILRFEANDIIESVGKSFYKPKRWPLDISNDGDDVLFTGYPGNRKKPLNGYLHFESVMLGMKVASRSDRKMLLRFENPKPELHLFSKYPVENYIWGGMSGSMVYRLEPNSSQFYVTGFLHAAGEGLNVNFYAGRADVIREDGTINTV